ncbi:hypothetical protein [Microvirga arabica]|uniref:hypothetical protein n=1 Tax=Microvirga arabica TaxID=1128671 RepID=UPI001939AB9D|nr:hypothetical protein [Microvirga arabica]MBM1172804.1 hypothetical protein [Microvirga arabica]
MKHGAFIGSTIMILAVAVQPSTSDARTDEGQAECDRLISMLEQKPPAEAHEAL